MDGYIESVQGPAQSKKNSKPKQSEPQDREDGFDKPELKVPCSVLDACQDSFTAADKAWKKSSNKFFDSMALMALICCHDCILWLVNMTSVGEKQLYALVALEMLFQHLLIE